MKRFIAMLLCMTSITMLSGCSAVDKVTSLFEEEEEVVEEPTEVYIPTLEETLGYTSYDLVAVDNVYSYQQTTLTSTIVFNETVNNRPVEHTVKTTIVHSSDEYRAYDCITTSDTYKETTDKTSTLIYTDAENGVRYTMYNYGGWHYEDYSGESEQYVYTLDSSKMTETSFEESNQRLYVEGSMSELSSSSFDQYIKYVLGQYGIDTATYTFKAAYEELTQQLAYIQADVTTDAEGVLGENAVAVVSFSVDVVPVKYNNTDVVTIPTYIPTSATMSEEQQAIIAEQQAAITEQAIAAFQFDADSAMYLTMFGCETPEAMTVDTLNAVGLTQDYLTTTYGIDGNLVQQCTLVLAQSYTYNGLLSLDYDSLSDGEKAGIDTLKAYHDTLALQQYNANNTQQ